MTGERGRRRLFGALFAAGLVGVVVVLPSLAQRLSGDSMTREGVGSASDVPMVQSIRGIEPLRTAFNEDAGRVRVYLLLSPT